VTIPRFSDLLPASRALSEGEQAAKPCARFSATQRAAIDAFGPRGIEAVELVAACIGAPGCGAIGHVPDGLQDGHHARCEHMAGSEAAMSFFVPVMGERHITERCCAGPRLGFPGTRGGAG